MLVSILLYLTGWPAGFHFALTDWSTVIQTGKMQHQRVKGKNKVQHAMKN